MAHRGFGSSPIRLLLTQKQRSEWVTARLETGVRPPPPTPIIYLLESLNVGAAELQVAVSGDHHSSQRHSWRTERPFSSWLHVCEPRQPGSCSPLPGPTLQPLTGLLELLLVIM